MGLVGAVLGQKYRVLRQIGEGGMGTVYEAEHTLIGRRVAIKTLRPEFAHSVELVRRFHREAQAASRIGHVNIIEVTDLGVTDGGSPYIVMEFLEGEPLSAVLDREGTLAPGRAADIVGQVLGALAAAHEKGIVHRDLKPENIFLITHGGREDFVKLLDFGISKFQTLVGDQRLTTSGIALGTPYYMAPEQAAGHTDLDHRVDIYATGAVLYEVLGGRPPYQGSNYNHLLAQIITTTPPPLHTLRPDVDPALERVVLTAMDRERDKRFASAQELLEALIPFGAGRTPFDHVVIGARTSEDARRRAAHLPTIPTPVSTRVPRPSSDLTTGPTVEAEPTPSSRLFPTAAALARHRRRNAALGLFAAVAALAAFAYLVFFREQRRADATIAASASDATDAPASPGPEVLPPALAAVPTIPLDAAAPAAPANDAADAGPPDAAAAKTMAADIDDAAPETTPDATPPPTPDAGVTTREAVHRPPDAGRRNQPDVSETPSTPAGPPDGLISVGDHTIRTVYEEP